MKNLALAMTVAAILGAVASTPAAAKGLRTYHAGYAPAYFAPAHYDATRYRGVVGSPYYYGFPFYSDWQIRWYPR